MNQPVITIEYVAMLREHAGCASETVPCASPTIADLYAERAAHHRFPWPASSLRPAVNNTFCPWTTPLQPGDRVLFLPPASGG
jgi:molybdopterin converting factor small subunit